MIVNSKIQVIRLDRKANDNLLIKYIMSVCGQTNKIIYNARK